MYLGGRETNKHKCKKTEKTQGRSIKTKTPIFGMVEFKYDYSDKGKRRVDTWVKAMKVANTQGDTLIPLIASNVSKGSMVVTDELSSYKRLNENGFEHRVIRHKNEEYGNGFISTNRIEGFWGGLKRMIFATYHYVSRNYLQRYLDEAVFRYNTRKMKVGERFGIMLSNSIGCCDYSQVKMVA